MALFLAAGAIRAAELDSLLLTGAVRDGRVIMSQAAIESLPPVRIETETPFTDGLHLFEGPLLVSLLEGAGASGTRLTVIGADGYAASMAVAEAKTLGAVLAYAMDGEPLKWSDKGPFWIVFPLTENPEYVTPHTEARMVWAVRRIEVR